MNLGYATNDENEARRRGHEDAKNLLPPRLTHHRIFFS